MSDLWQINGDMGQSFLPDSRGLAYGDGLFETMRVIGDGIPLLENHLSRLERGAGRLGIQLDLKLVRAWIKEAISHSDYQQAVVKMICTRKGSAMGYKSVEQEADILLRISELQPQLPDVGLKAKVCSLRLSAQPVLAGIKHLNRLEQVLASQELSDGYDEGLLLDDQDHILEAISSNLILVKNSDFVFPDLSQSGVQGVMQEYLKQVVPKLGARFIERPVSVDELQDFDEILLTNAVRGVRNLVSIEAHWQGDSYETGEKLRNSLTDKLGFTSF